MNFEVVNTGNDDMSFTAALHTYFAVEVRTLLSK